MPERSHFPVFRHLAEPLDSGVFEGWVGVEAGGLGGFGWESARYGAGDQRCPILLQALDEQALLRYQRVDAFGLVVEEGCDVALLVEGWEEYGGSL